MSDLARGAAIVDQHSSAKADARLTPRDAPVTRVVLPERLVVIVDIHLRHTCEVSPQGRLTNQQPSIRVAS